jgi:hypothetical protein
MVSSKDERLPRYTIRPARSDNITEGSSDVGELNIIVTEALEGLGKTVNDFESVLDSFMAVRAETFRLSRYKLFPWPLIASNRNITSELPA